MLEKILQFANGEAYDVITIYSFYVGDFPGFGYN